MRLWIVGTVVTLGAIRATTRLAAQDEAGYDTTAVVSGGHWSTGNSAGTYRVIVHTAGTEHVASSIKIEWVRSDGHRTRVVASLDSVTYVPDRMYSLDIPKFDETPAGSRIFFCGTHAYSGDNTCWKVVLGPPGTIVSSDPVD